jgi:hypothetical protein
MVAGDSLGVTFVRMARDVLARHPALRHQWQLAADGTGTLTIPPSAGGFDITVAIERDSLVVYASGCHEHFDPWMDASADTLASKALDLIRDLLSPDMRVREISAGDRPYRWVIERRIAGGWKTESSAYAIPWNFLAPRTERVYQNDQLPSRHVNF